jgi:hypothetical protein
MRERLDYNKPAPAGINALDAVYGYVTQSGLSPVLVAPEHSDAAASAPVRRSS